MNNIDQQILELVANAIGPELLQEVVFVGGITTSLYIENILSPATTPTEDVDLIVDIVSHYDYEQFEKKIAKRGFKRDLLNPGPLCRYHLKDIIVDFMPLNEKILGFTNSWYSEGFKNSISVRVGEIEIRILSLPYFLATKLEAFESRGNKKFFRDSKDFEDIIVVLDGRKDLENDLQHLPPMIANLVRTSFKFFFKDDNVFKESVAACLNDYGLMIATQKANALAMKMRVF